MTIAIIITISVLLLFAYVFDITSAKTKIPSVILLLILGWIVRQGLTMLGISIPNLQPVLPVLGTIGLILIVLEGSLELELNNSKFPIIIKSFLVALLSVLALSFGLAYAFQYFGEGDFKMNLANAIPLAIISSAIAIPSVKNLNLFNKEFVTYESSLSDILGVILFNFIILNEYIGTNSIGFFVLKLVIIMLISFGASLALAFLLSKIKHHVKFAPIILLIILIYEVSKIYHLPGLIFILMFGIFIGNLDELKQFRFIRNLHPEILNKEVHKFKELTGEMVFLIRSLFFILFGYLIENAELFNPDTLVWAILIATGIYLLRWILLRIFLLPISPLLYVAPRGLITILLFLSIPADQVISLNNKSLIIQVIILTALMMMVGLIKIKKDETKHENNFSF